MLPAGKSRLPPARARRYAASTRGAAGADWPAPGRFPRRPAASAGPILPAPSPTAPGRGRAGRAHRHSRRESRSVARPDGRNSGTSIPAIRPPAARTAMCTPISRKVLPMLIGMPSSAASQPMRITSVTSPCTLRMSTASFSNSWRLPWMSRYSPVLICVQLARAAQESQALEIVAQDRILDPQQLVARHRGSPSA